MPEVRELLQALAALEHEVLEQVREAGAALGLGAEPDVDVHRDADDGGVRVGGEEHAQPVGEGGAVEVGHDSDSNRPHRRRPVTDPELATARHSVRGGDDRPSAGQAGGSTTNWRRDRSG